MNEPVYSKSILAISTNTNKNENQDSAEIVEGSNFNSIIIADGLGTYKYARLASQRITSFFKNWLQNLDTSENNNLKIKFKEVFKLAKNKLSDYALENKNSQDAELQFLFGTTAIILYETSNELKIAYTGNGAIWHIRGNFTEFPPPHIFPWNALNILNPHTIPENGKEALYRLISDSPNFEECVPSIITIEKDSEFGDIIFICTDGIYSEDQRNYGKNEKGVWIKYEPSMLEYFDFLKAFFKTNLIYNNEQLTKFSDEYLDKLKPNLEDDATVGILMTSTVLNYQNHLKWKSDEINTNYQV